MRFLGTLAAAALLTGGAAPGQTPDTAAQIKNLEGRWLVAHRAVAAAALKTEVARRLTDLGTEVEIADGKLAACDKDKQGRHLLLDIDPAPWPKEIDLKVPGKKDQVFLGIYNVEKDILTLAVGTGKKRPYRLEYSDEQVLIILKRKPPRR